MEWIKRSPLFDLCDFEDRVVAVLTKNNKRVFRQGYKADRKLSALKLFFNDSVLIICNISSAILFIMRSN